MNAAKLSQFFVSSLKNTDPVGATRGVAFLQDFAKLSMAEKEKQRPKAEAFFRLLCREPFDLLDETLFLEAVHKFSRSKSKKETEAQVKTLCATLEFPIGFSRETQTFFHNPVFLMTALESHFGTFAGAPAISLFSP